MMAKTHLAWSIVTLIGASAAASIAGVPVTPSATVMMMPLVMIGGLLPDLVMHGETAFRPIHDISATPAKHHAAFQAERHVQPPHSRALLAV